MGTMREKSEFKAPKIINPATKGGNMKKGLISVLLVVLVAMFWASPSLGKVGPHGLLAQNDENALNDPPVSPTEIQEFMDEPIAPARPPTPREIKIDRLKDRMVELNSHIPDFKKMEPGDVVYIPLENGGQIPCQVKREKGLTSIWEISESYLYGNLAEILQPRPIGLKAFNDLFPPVKDEGPVIKQAPAPNPAPRPAPDSTSQSQSIRFPWLLLLAIVAFIAGFFLLYLNNNSVKVWIDRQRGRRNPDIYPPIMEEGLSQNLTQAAEQITESYPPTAPSRRIKMVERGRVIRHSGPKVLESRMTFGDGQNRDVDVENGDLVYRVTLLDDTHEFYRTHCGNLMGEVKGGQFELPAGWEFVVEAAQDIPQPEDSTPAPETPTSTPKPEPESVPETPPVKPAEVKAPSKTTKPQLQEVEVVVEEDEGAMYTFRAKGTADAMPTRLEKDGGKIVIYFPKQ